MGSKKYAMKRRVVITGIGIIAPNGQGKEEFWDNCTKGTSYITSDPKMLEIGLKSSVLCKIKDFDLKSHVNLDHYEGLLDLDPFVQYGVAAGEQAIIDSCLANVSDDYRERVGIIFSSAIGGTPTIVNIFEDLTESGKTHIQHKSVGSRFYNSGMFNYPAMLLAKKFNFSGPCTSVSTGCTAGVDALGMAYHLIRSNEIDVMLAGASEAPLTNLTYATLDVINAMSTTECEPHKASRPFDAKRSGFVISEGAAVVVLEELEHALARGAHIYAEVKSFASVSNSHHMTDLPADGVPMATVVQLSLDKAGLAPKEIDYINAHGSSTPQNDLFETSAYKVVFKEHAKNIPISSTKSMIGHSLSSASLIGVISVLGSIRRSVIHPTINYEFPDNDCDLDYVSNKARYHKVRYGMVTASGFGGIHSTAIFAKYDETAL